MKSYRYTPFRVLLLLLTGMAVLFSCDSSVSVDDSLFASGPDAGDLCEETYPCMNITLLANLNPEDLLGERLNDVWGWTDPQTSREYALVGLTDRVTFVDVSDPQVPVVVGTLPESIHSGSEMPDPIGYHHDDEEGEGKSAWRDIKVYQNHAFVVSDGQPHGLQVFDLTRLRDVADPPATFTEDLHYTDFGNAHNIAINEASGYAYVVGSNRFGGGLYILDIRDPLSPVLAGSHSDAAVGSTAPGYVHDTQCVMYNGPDPDYAGREVCFNSSETHFVIADVTDKQSTATISRNTYSGNRYAHQGWLTEDHRYFLLDDELDESNDGIPTTTYIWDVQDLDSPVLAGVYSSGLSSIDHNQYIRGDYAYQANYTSGLRILRMTDLAAGVMEEVAYFDTYPTDDALKFDGAWSNYPYFESGIVLVSDVSNGLFILSPELE